MNKELWKNEGKILGELILVTLLACISFYIFLSIKLPILALIIYILVWAIGSFIVNLWNYKNNKHSAFNFFWGILTIIIVIWFISALAYYKLPSKGDNTMKVENVQKNLTLEESLYFSTVTMTTLGYGDIVPGGYFRWIAMNEVISGVIFIGYFISGLSKILDKNN